MLDSRTVLDPLWRATDSNGDPITGAKLKFYLAGTTDPLTVYSDSALTASLGTTVTCDSAGCPTADGSTKVSIWTGTASYKIVITDADDVTVATYDNQDGAIDPADLPASGSGSGLAGIESGAGDYTVVVGDDGKLFNRSANFIVLPVSSQTISQAGRSIAALSIVDGTGAASSQITLPSAVTAGDGFTVGFRHSGTGEVVWITSDGANWIVAGARHGLITPNAPPTLIITSRITSEPSSPPARALYIIDGSPTGVLATLGLAANDVLEADGNGGWIRHVPAEGWLAYSTSDDSYYSFTGSAWTRQTGMVATSTASAQIIVSDTKASGTQGGAATTTAWTAHTLNTTDANTITGASLSSDTITLPAGTYDVTFWAAFELTNATRLRLKSTTTATAIYAPGITLNAADSSGGILSGTGRMTLAASESFKLEYYVAISSSANALGRPASISSVSEVYAQVKITDLSSVRGATGATGAQGAAGAGYSGTSSTSLALTNTGTVSATVSTGLAYTVGSRVGFYYQSDTSKWMMGLVTSYNSGTGALQFTADYNSSTGTYASWYVALAGTRGADGATGAAGPSPIDYTGDSGTSAADPGSGRIRVNNASMASATAIYINETDRHGTSQAAWLATLDDSTSTTRGYLYINDLTTTSQKWVYRVTGSVSDNGSYDTVTVAYVSGPAVAMPSNNVALLFVQTGDKGADGAGTGDVVGPAASVDSEIALYSSTTGKLLKRATTTGILKASSGVLSAAVSGTDYAPATSGTSLLKGNGSGGFSSAASGTDYAPATSGTALLKGNGSGGFSIAASGSDYAPPTSGTAMLKGSGSGGFSSAVSGTDYAPPTSGSSVLKGNGTGGFSSAVSGTDYAPATSGSSLLKGNGAGGFSNAAAGTDYQAPIGTISGVAKGNGANALTAATAGTDYVAPGTATNFTAQQYFGLATLTDGASISWTVSSGQKAKVTLGGNRTMSAVTGAVEGATYLLWVIQDGTGSRTIAWTTTGSGSFDFGTDGAPTLTTAASKADLLAFEAISIGGTLKLRYAGIKKGFA